MNGLRQEWRVPLLVLCCLPLVATPAAAEGAWMLWSTPATVTQVRPDGTVSTAQRDQEVRCLDACAGGLS